MKGAKRTEQIGDCTLHLGDCLEIMPELGKVDAVVTDPPYGVRLGTKSGTRSRKTAKPYNAHPDTPDYIKSVCVPAVLLCRDLARTTIVTSGNRCMWLYPQPDDFGVWWNPAGTSMGRFGFQNVGTPLLYYGSDPRAGKKGLSSSSPVGIAASRDEENGHPCPKPISITKWLVTKASLDSETILDPFMGSGTTGVACVQLNRRFIGIELDETYFDIACKRIEEAYKQPQLFPVEKPKPAKTGELFGEGAA